jgi:hypothetical protein
VEYEISELGRSLAPLFETLADWWSTWTRSSRPGWTTTPGSHRQARPEDRGRDLDRSHHLNTLTGTRTDSLSVRVPVGLVHPCRAGLGAEIGLSLLDQDPSLIERPGEVLVLKLVVEADLLRRRQVEGEVDPVDT